MKIGHIAMYVDDITGAADFFARYLGGRCGAVYHNAATGFRSVFVSFSDGARLEIMNRPSMTDAGSGLYSRGLNHIAFSLGSREAVDELTLRLRRDGYEILSGPRTTGDGYYESCVIAVEGNVIELTV